MKIEEILKRLDAPLGVSGNEFSTAKEVESLFSLYCDKVYKDALGNVIGVRYSKRENAKRLMVEGHMDEIGLMVTKITPEGFLLFTTIGGIDPKILPACEVIVHGREDIFGVIGAMPPHLQKEGEDEVLISNMAIDVGMKDPSHLISVGDTVTFKTGYFPLFGSRCAARCHDDRAGIAAVVKMLEELKDTPLPFDLYAVATVQEEVGLRGAATAAYSIAPHCAISIDVTHGDTPDAQKDKTFPLGKGCAISLGPNIHREQAEHLLSVAKEKDIPFSLDTDGGDTGTNAWAVQVAGEGAATLLLSIPLRYMHTNFETLDTKDVLSVACLLKEFAKSGWEEIETVIDLTEKGGSALC